MFLWLLIGLLVSYVVYLFNVYSYWRRRGVVGPTPLPLVGNYGSLLLGKGVCDILFDIYKQYPSERFVGLYKGTKPILLIRDPLVIKQMLWENGEVFLLTPASALLQSLRKSIPGANHYASWKILRTSFMPTLSKHNIAKTLPLTEPPLKNYMKCIERLIEKNDEQNILIVNEKFVLEFLGAMVFGRDLGLFSDENKIAKQLNTYNKRYVGQIQFQRMTLILPILGTMMKPLIMALFGTLIKFYTDMTVSIISEKQDQINYSDIHVKPLLYSIKERKGTQKIKIDNTIHELTIDDEHIVNHVTATWAGNAVSNSKAISYLLLELAHNQGMQERAREEIDQILKKYNGRVTFATISELKYLEMITNEVWRKYLSQGYFHRESSKSYLLPGTNITIERGTEVNMSSLGVHFDPQYYSHPEIFDPDRFSPENTANPKNTSKYLSFGYGFRDCIAKNLVNVVVVSAIAAFLYNFKVTPSSRSELWKPGQPGPPRLAGNVPGIWIKVHRRTDQ